MGIRTDIVAKAVVINEGGKVLLIRRSATDGNRAGEQDFPGGGVEIGEDYVTAVAREILEETGLRADRHELRLFYTFTEFKRDKNIIRMVFWTRIKGQTVKLSREHDASQWVDPDKVQETFPHPVYGESVRYALKHGLFDAH
jgi:8-oxo-dGTP diphosphatase